MKKLFIPVIFLLCVILSCAGSKPVPHFTLNIVVPHESGPYVYELTDSALTIRDPHDPQGDIMGKELFHIEINDNDSLRLVAQMDIKSFDCRKQHALVASAITFITDSSTVNVSPGINHPKELDYAVDIINSLVPDEYKLMFEDMQRAGDPNEKMNI